MRCPTRCAPLAIALLGVAARHAHAQAASAGDSADRSATSPKRCIFLPNLDRTDVIDDRTIVFHMRNGTLYLNHLSRDCPGLKREKRFMYSPTSSQLCAIDGVTVIEKWGFGFTRGFTCSLGEFNPMTKVEYQALLRSEPKDSGAEAAASRNGIESVVPVKPVEPPGAQGAAAPPGDKAALARPGSREGSESAAPRDASPGK